MGEIKQRVEVLAPHYLKTLKFSGYHPSRTLKIMPPLMKETFKVTSTNFFEDVIKWDTSGETTMFFGAWRGKYTEDERTTRWIQVKVQGEQNEKTLKGKVTIWLRSYLITTFKYSNPIIKEFLRLYSYYFYSERRRIYTEAARNLLNILEKELRVQLEEAKAPTEETGE
jgi:hypothetical protein